MHVAFYIVVGYAALGIAYAPGADAVTAFLYIAVSAAPLAFALPARPQALYRVRRPPPAPLYWGCLVAGFANVGLVALSSGNTLADLFSVEGVLRIAAASTVQRYTEGAASGNPVLMALALFLLYRTGAAAQRVGALKTMLAFLPLVAYAVVSTEKYPLLLGASFFMTGYLTTRPLALALPGIVRYASYFLVFGLALGVLALLTKGREGDLVGQLLHYVLAPFAAFGAWLGGVGTSACCEFGALTFIGPLDAAGIVERRLGVFEDEYFVHGRSTNIMTAWKYLVSDFSVVGPFALNLLLLACWTAAQRLHNQAMSGALNIVVVFAALVSMVVTPFVHNSVVLALALSLASFLMARVVPAARTTPQTAAVA